MSEYPGMKPPLTIADVDPSGTLFEGGEVSGKPSDALLVEKAADSGVQSFDDAYRALGIPKPQTNTLQGPSLNSYERAESELTFVKLIADNEKMSGWIKILEKEFEVNQGKDVKQKIDAARNKIKENSRLLKLAYKFDELTAVDFDEADVTLQFNEMVSEYRAQFIGEANRVARESRKRYLENKRVLGQAAIDPWVRPELVAKPPESSLEEEHEHPVPRPKIQPIDLTTKAARHLEALRITIASIRDNTDLTASQKAVKLRALRDKDPDAAALGA